MRMAPMAAALLLMSGYPAFAQTAPDARPAGTARGSEIRIERPDMSVFVRCGDGETAKSCADTAQQLMEKVAAMPMPEGRGRRGGDDRRNRDRDRERD